MVTIFAARCAQQLEVLDARVSCELVLLYALLWGSHWPHALYAMQLDTQVCRFSCKLIEGDSLAVCMRLGDFVALK